MKNIDVKLQLELRVPTAWTCKSLIDFMQESLEFYASNFGAMTDETEEEYGSINSIKLIGRSDETQLCLDQLVWTRS